MMKNLIITTILCIALQPVFAQPAADPLKFDQPFTRCEKKWVVLWKPDTAAAYPYGFVYIDHQAGFTFDFKGTLKIDAQGKYIRHTTAPFASSVKHRMGPNWRKVALLPPSHFAELNIDAEPDIVKHYYAYTDTVAHNYRWGWAYNDAHDSEIALPYLLKAYQQKPEYPGLEFEIIFAYNELKRYDDAIVFLNSALKKRSDDAMLYRELGFAYLEKGEHDKSISYYKKGMDKCTDKQLDTKSEMALNMANAYKQKGDNAEYDKWLLKAKEWAPPGSQIYNHLNKQAP